MNKFIVFVVLSLPVIYVSRKPLLDIKSHGFYRFFGWEGILWLTVSNFKYWFVNSFSVNQIFSWILLTYAIIIVIAGAILIINAGKPDKKREGETLYQFEKTTELVKSGIYKYIRHPLYGSLVFLTWGIFLKNMTVQLFIVTLISTLFFYLTMRIEEQENIAYFGDKYRDYVKESKMFIPFIL